LKSGQDFLPVVFTADMRVLACITFTNILEHLVTHFREQRRLFDDGIIDLGIGTYGDKLVTVTPQQTLAEALELMSAHGISALPVIDHPSTRKLLGVYARSDISFLTRATDAEDAVRNLDLTISEILSQARQDVTTPDALRIATPDATLQAIFESFSQLRFNRLYVVDAEEHLIGAVSAKDLVAYFLSDADQDVKDVPTGQ
jgi:CBS domain-containing protein